MQANADQHDALVEMMEDDRFDEAFDYALEIAEGDESVAWKIYDEAVGDAS